MLWGLGFLVVAGAFGFLLGGLFGALAAGAFGFLGGFFISRPLIAAGHLDQDGQSSRPG
jgi:hypothetical protein